MKKICIALDYNPSAEKVAQTGYAYAKALGSETILAHVTSDLAYYNLDYSPIMGYIYPINTKGINIAAEISHVAENFLSAAAEHLGGKDIKTEVLNGIPDNTAKTLLKFCETNLIDLLVIGTHGHSALENVLMGNTAVRVVRHTKIPLLVVPVKK